MTKYFTDKQWLSLPRNLKLRWWKETDYGKLKPSTQLLKEMNMELNKMNQPLHNAPIRADLYDDTLNGYQAATQTTAIYPGQGTINGLLYTTLKLNGEAGEIAEKVGKALRDDFACITDQRRADLLKELGDVLWYVAATARELGFNLSEVALANLDKLKDRQNRDKLSGSGDNR